VWQNGRFLKILKLNDTLRCPQCGGEMKVISFIEDHKVIDKIIRHLKLVFHAERPPTPQVVQQEPLMEAEERGISESLLIFFADLWDVTYLIANYLVVFGALFQLCGY
jgi:hypothetical protein